MPTTRHFAVGIFRRAGGFSLLEVTIAGLLSTVLLVMIGNVWRSFSLATRRQLDDVGLASDARLAQESFRRDLAGHLPGAAAGEPAVGRFVGRLCPQSGRLMLCFDGAPTNQTADWLAPDVVVEYSVENGQLLRTDNATNAVLVVAEGVATFAATEQSDGVRLDLTLQRRDLIRTYTWIARDP